MNISKQNIGALAASMLALAATTAAWAETPSKVRIPGRLPLPESITSSTDGALYIGSIRDGAVYRAAPGATEAVTFISGHTAGLQSVFGVYADDARNTLWVCSGTFSFTPLPPDAPRARLHSFKLKGGGNLKDGAPTASYEMPTPGAGCNDIAIGKDGTVYATDTFNMQVVRLPKGGKALEVWTPDGAVGAKGGVLDGISIVGDRVVVNNLATGKLFAVPIGKGGKAGKATEITLDRALERPDGMRTFGKDGVLVVEDGAGRLSHVVISGDKGKVTTVADKLTDVAAVTVAGDTAWVLQSQFSNINAAPDADVTPAYAVPVSLK
jgi:hypothetical protein